MTMQVESVDIPIVDDGGRTRGALHVRVLPSTRSITGPAPLLDARGCIDEALPAIQLLEATEYGYEVRLDGPGPSRAVRCEPAVMFHPDDSSGWRGRLRTGLYTGTVEAGFYVGNRFIGRASFEVRAAKLDYLTHYRCMLYELAETAAELLMERFAPSWHTFRPSPSREPRVAYQQFAFLRSLLLSEHFRAAMSQILSNPYLTWATTAEERPAGTGAPARSQVLRALAGPRPRIRLPQGARLGPLSHVPERLPHLRTEPSVDNPENRFVRHALEAWRDFAQRVRDVLLAYRSTMPVERGLRESQEVIDGLENLLASGFLREVGQVTQLPSSSQVLQRRAGYRDVLRFFLQFQMAAEFHWPGGEEVFAAGKRDVAKLYEFWVYMHMVRLIGELCGRKVDFSSLFEVGEGGLQLRLRTGDALAVAGEVERLGRRLLVQLWFNRTFAPSDPAAPSWTRRMRPDYSLRVTPAPGSRSPFPEVWLHFDAKYRLEDLAYGFGADDGDGEEQDAHPGVPPREAELARRADLLKMHAYRDAIRRSVGAYVIYPGTEQLLWREYHEILPGLGAFVLRPSPTGEPEGLDGLRRFLDDVLTHVASQLTRDERGRYWVREAYERGPGAAHALPATPFLARPPADTVVLLGFVRNKRHLEWIHRCKRYNLRADERAGRVELGSRELAAELLVLYGPSLREAEVWRIAGAPEIWSRDDMLRSGYPKPGGKAYFCLPLEAIPAEQLPLRLEVKLITQLWNRLAAGRPFGHPVAATWYEVVAAHGERFGQGLHARRDAP